MVLQVANLVLNFQSYERVHFWSFHVLSLWHFVMAAYSVCNRDKLGVPSKFTVPPALKWKDALSKHDCLTVSARILCLGPDKPNSVIGRDQHRQPNGTVTLSRVRRSATSHRPGNVCSRNGSLTRRLVLETSW